MLELRNDPSEQKNAFGHWLIAQGGFSLLTVFGALSPTYGNLAEKPAKEQAAQTS